MADNQNKPPEPTFWELRKRISNSPCFLPKQLDIRRMNRTDCIDFTNGHAECLNSLLKKNPTKEAPFCCRKLIAVVTAGKGLTDPATYFPGCVFNKTCKSGPGKTGKRRITGPELQKLASQGHDRALIWREKYYENNKDKEDDSVPKIY